MLLVAEPTLKLGLRRRNRTFASCPQNTNATITPHRDKNWRRMLESNQLCLIDAANILLQNTLIERHAHIRLKLGGDE